MQKTLKLTLIFALLTGLMSVMQSCLKKSSLPILETFPVYEITNTTAVSGGVITDDGGSAVTARGVCWSINVGPTIADSKTSDSTGVGAYTSNMTGLTPDTVYYVRAYATNGKGTAYGSQQVFATVLRNGPTLFNPDLTYDSVTDIDGNVYKTIQIGTQTWMAENLGTTRMNDGTYMIPDRENNVWETLTAPGYGWYNNDSATYKATYGAYYNWQAVTSGKLCPSGWHVPSDAEWHTLILKLDVGAQLITGVESTSAGDSLKESGTTHWIAGNKGVNSTGFTSLPGGSRLNTGYFFYLGEAAYFWSSTESLAGGVWYRAVSYNFSGVGRSDNAYGNVKTYGLSVRCLKN